jgi:DNA-binding MarR family transcriptional regulator
VTDCKHGAPPPDYTPQQGQYLTFIYYYTKIHRRPPAEADLQDYFRVTPPAVHNMVMNLEKRGFISRTPRAARSIRLLLAREQLPDLE